MSPLDAIERDAAMRPRWRKYDVVGCDACRREVLDDSVVSFQDKAGDCGSIVLCRACVKAVAKSALSAPKTKRVTP